MICGGHVDPQTTKKLTIMLTATTFKYQTNKSCLCSMHSREVVASLLIRVYFVSDLTLDHDVYRDRAT